MKYGLNLRFVDSSLEIISENHSLRVHVTLCVKSVFAKLALLSGFALSGSDQRYLMTRDL